MRRVLLPAMVLAMTLGLVATASAFESVSHFQSVGLKDAEGHAIGTVNLRGIGTTAVEVRVSARYLTPGFHGFHVHSVGVCEAPFTSAGPHLNLNGASHPNHEGDMPVLYALADGKAKTEFITNRFSLAELMDGDGSSFIIHANPDNYANIPTERYDPDPDASTLGTGDAGPRVVCGAIPGA